MSLFTAEQIIALITLLTGAISGGVGVAFKRWSDTKVIEQTAAFKAEADKSKALSDAWERLVTSAEKREAAANERTDRTIASVAQLTTTVGELSMTLKLLSSTTTEITGNQKLILDEMRKCVNAMEGVARDLARR